MTAKELDSMVNAMRSKYYEVNTRMDVTNPIYYLQKGLKAIGRDELADKLNDLYAEIDGIDTSEIVKIGTFDKSKYRFEWVFEEIKDQKSFETFCKNMLKEKNPYFNIPYNYETAARLFYKQENGECVLIELQVPTYVMMDFLQVGKDEISMPWLEAFEVEDMQDYGADTDTEIYTGIDNGTVITYDNAVKLMLELAIKMFE